MIENSVYAVNDFEQITTQGIKYTGSKDLLIPHILQNIAQLSDVKTVLDGFSGTTRVSQALAKSGYNVIANDTAVWSKIFAQCYLLNKKDKNYYQPIIHHLNQLKGRYGWFSKHYGAKETDTIKRPWQVHNTMKLDAIRAEIEHIAQDEIEKSVLLTALILALDKVDNTIGHYVAYLKKWSQRSYNTMYLEVPDIFDNSKNTHLVYQQDIFELIPHIQADLAYYDPPYGSANNKMPPSRVRYAAYYHIWTTIIQNDKPALFGKNNRRIDSSDKLAYSPFEDYKKDEDGQFIAAKSIDKLIKLTHAKYILFSYSSGGRVPINQLIQIFQTHTSILNIQKIDYKKNVMSNMKWTEKWANDDNLIHQEYLFLLEKK